MKVSILQSNYLPWKGYFDIIRKSDIFIFYDDVQFTKNDWRNRNLIKSAKGVEWISVPVGSKIHRLIREVKIESHDWQKSHWDKIKANYKKAPYFKSCSPFFEELFLGKKWDNLSELNQNTIERISREFLGATNTKFLRSSDYFLEGSKQERLILLLKKVGATTYLSGPSARSYLEPETFRKSGLEIEYMDYSKYPTYPQLNPPFEHAVSIIDLILNCGPQAEKFF